MAQVHEKDVLKYIITEPGEPCVMKDSLTHQPELFATCSDLVMSGRLLLTATGPAVDRFGWTTFGVMELKRTLDIVDTEDGAVTTAETVNVNMYQCPATQV